MVLFGVYFLVVCLDVLKWVLILVMLFMKLFSIWVWCLIWKLSLLRCCFSICFIWELMVFGGRCS